MLQRIVEPELGDQLSPDDPRAQRLRRDLRRINRLARSDHHLASALLRHQGGTPPRRIVELGAGDGDVMLRLARRLAPRWKGVEVTLVDLQDAVRPAVRAECAALGWTVHAVADDVFHYLGEAGAPCDIVVANAFLHHFHEPQLRELLRHAARLAPLVVALEPRRSRTSLRLSRWVGALGYSEVFRQDLLTSVRAGFKGRELSALGPADADWLKEEVEVGLFLHRFVAKRRNG